jgi:hypothetical protein
MKNIVVIIIFLLQNTLFAQVTLKEIAQKLASQLPQEKVYLSLDKPQYVSGETIRFKAFAVGAGKHNADSISGVLHVELINPISGTIYSQKMYPLQGSTANGDFETENIEGEVLIHAYTHWMLNMPADFHFNKKILVAKADNTTPSVSDTKNSGLKLSFFPEGGQMVAGLSSKVAFKATNEKGSGLPVSGAIIDEAGTGVVIFKDEHLGMGSFAFMPEKGRKYQAQVNNADGTKTNFPLPQVLEEGFVLAADNFKDKDNVRLTVQTNLPDAQMPKALYLIAHTRGIINFAFQLDILDKKKKAFLVNIPREKLDIDGIVHLTLFTEKGLPICERLIFNENKKQRMAISLKTDKETYKPREKITLNIETTDSEGKPLSTDIALAVTNIGKVAPPQYGEHLMAYMLLGADLGGHIEQPAYYFEDTTHRAKRALDHLMMTHGWRRFVWKEILAQEEVPVPRNLPQAGLTVEGTVMDNKKPIGDSQLLLTLFNEREGNQPFFVTTDKKGNFKIENIYY